MTKKLHKQEHARPPPLPKAVRLKGHPGEDSLADNPWQLEWPDKSEVGSILFNAQPRRWLHVDKQGNLKYHTVERADLVHDLNVSYRDVRILDPLAATPYPAAILIREKALIINLEAVRMIICKDQCFILSVPHANIPGTTGMFPTTGCEFIRDLLALIHGHAGNGSDVTFSHASSELDAKLPWELRALEAALQAAGRGLATDTRALEEQTLPSLSRLMQKITDADLEQLRTTKAALNSLIQRVSQVRHELEETLDDDEEMLDMYLGRRAQEAEAAACLSSGSHSTPTSPQSPAQRSRESPAERQQPAAALPADRYAESGSPGVELSADSVDDVGSSSAAARRKAAASSIRDGNAAAVAGCQIHDGTSADGGTPASAGSPAQLASTSASAADMSADGPRPARLLRSAAEPHDAAHDAAARPVKHTLSVPEHMAAVLGRLQTLQQTGGLQGEGLTLEDVAAAGLYAMSRPGGPGGGGGHAPPNPRDISECEGLLEVYFKQMDDLLRRLVSTRARIADTEAKIEISLDHRRNELQALTLVVNSVMLSFAAVSMVVGAFGMNLGSFSTAQSKWYWAFCGPLVIAGAMFLMIMLYARKKRLLWIPEAL